MLRHMKSMSDFFIQIWKIIFLAGPMTLLGKAVLWKLGSQVG